MKKYKKISFIFIWLLLIAGTIVCESFVSKKQNENLCGMPIITILEDEDLLFLNNLDVMQMLELSGNPIVGQLKSTIDVLRIKNILIEHPAIAKTEISISVDGVLQIVIKQRKPIIRVITKSNEEYYIDETGRLMPVSDKYTAKVLVANGNISESYNQNYLNNFSENLNDTTKKSETILSSLFVIAKYISEDKFWKLQIQQVFVNEENEIELTPLVGNHKIIFGDTTAMVEKFNKLKTFYTEGLNPTGNWEKYSLINLKYHNQIVCTKK